MAHLEAFIDFGDDEQIFHIDPATCDALHALLMELQLHLRDHRRGEIARNGAKICILGKPNAGKSSLFNLLLRRKASIVSNIPGTTRDVIQRSINIGGYAVRLFDTAGIHHSPQCPIETEGISIGLGEAQEADFLIFVISLEDARDASVEEFQHWLELHLPALSQQTKDAITAKAIFLLNKSDLLATNPDARLRIESEWKNHFGKNVLTCTLHQESGDITIIATMLKSMLRDRIGMDPQSCHGDVSVLFRERHRPHLMELEACLSNALQLLKNPANEDAVIAGELLRRACTQLGYITGRISSEDVLDALFKNFCIGK